MLIGTMNIPTRLLELEFDRTKEVGFDYLDLTYEYPYAHPERSAWQKTFDMIKSKGLPIVGHTDYIFPIAIDHPHTRYGVIKDIEEAIEFLALAGARSVTVHVDKGKTLQHPDKRIELQIGVLEALIVHALKFNVQVMLENSHNASIREYELILEALPKLGVHLDVGHAMITGGIEHVERILALDRLAHVHLSDNDGKSDLHLPLASCYRNPVSWETIIGMIKDTGYNGTITLEVFSPERELLNWSKDYLKRLWG